MQRGGSFSRPPTAACTYLWRAGKGRTVGETELIGIGQIFTSSKLSQCQNLSSAAVASLNLIGCGWMVDDWQWYCYVPVRKVILDGAIACRYRPRREFLRRFSGCALDSSSPWILDSQGERLAIVSTRTVGILSDRTLSYFQRVSMMYRCRADRSLPVELTTIESPYSADSAWSPEWYDSGRLAEGLWNQLCVDQDESRRNWRYIEAGGIPHPQPTRRPSIAKQSHAHLRADEYADSTPVGGGCPSCPFPPSVWYYAGQTTLVARRKGQHVDLEDRLFHAE